MSQSRPSGDKYGNIVFPLIDTPYFSGHAMVTETLIRSLQEVGKNAVTIKLPTIDRNNVRFWGTVWKMLQAYPALWLLAEVLLLGRQSVYVSLPQSLVGIIREGVLPAILFRRRGSRWLIFALNGGNFMTWDPDHRRARLLKWVLNSGDCVSVVSDRQRAKLIDLGVQAERIEVVQNTCDAKEYSVDALRAKHSLAGRLEVVYLSSLIDTKGYCEYVEAIAHLARQEPIPELRATLCGPVVIGPYSSRFGSTSKAGMWIRERVDWINTGGRTSIRVIASATGEKKWRLLREAHVFVLPTKYPVEAQPIALLEAMAFGAVPIVCRTGAIPETVDETCAIMLNSGHPEEIAEAITNVSRDHALRMRLAVSAKNRFHAVYARDAFRERWLEIIGRLDRGRRCA